MKNKVFSLRERPKFFGETYVLNLFEINHPIFVFIYYCDLSLQRFWGQLQLCSWKYFNQNSYVKIMVKQKDKHIFSLRKLKLLLLKTIMFPEKKGLCHSLEQLKLLLFGNMIVPQGEANFPRVQWTFLEKMSQKTYVLNFYAIISHICFYRGLWLIIGKV